MGCRKLDISKNYESVLTVVGKSLTTEKLQVEHFWETKKMGVNYYPFGATMPGRSFNSGEYRYGFNGQEKDDEIKGAGNSYDFGARILDVRLGGGFLSLDAYSSHYPSISPYAFVARNPIFYVDPDGNQIVVHYIGRLGIPQKIVYEPGMATIGNKFADEVIRSLNYLIDNNAGSNVINDLVTDEKTVDIKRGWKLNSVYQIDGHVTWNPYSGLAVRNPNGNIEFQSPALGLLHELGHAWFLFKGINFNEPENIPQNQDQVPKEHAELLRQIEKPAAIILGEGIRETYNNAIGEFKSIGSTINEPTSTRKNRKEAEKKDNQRSKSCSVRTLCCFVAGTLVLTSDGTTKPIEKINIGDTVKTVNTNIMALENSIVQNISSPFHDDIVNISFEDGTSNSNTFDHSYYIKNKGWSSYKPKLTNEHYQIKAQQLEIGDTVLKYANGTLEGLKIIEISENIGEKQTYNIFTGDGNTSYFANGILVHDESVNTLIEVGKGYGLFEIGKTSLKDIRKELGKVKIDKYKVKRERIKIEHRIVNYEEMGIEFDFNRHNILQSIQFKKNSKMRTTEGVTIGESDEKNVISIYGTPLDSVIATTYIYYNIGASFQFKDGKVIRISIFSPLPTDRSLKR